MTDAMKAMIRASMWLFGSRLNHFFRDRQGIAATEFAMIAPFMLIAFFGVVEFCSAVAVDRKVTLIAHTLVDLTSQQAPPTISTDSATITDNALQNNFSSGGNIIASYDPTPLQSTISEIYVDHNGNATILWSKSATIQSGATVATLTNSPRNQGDDVTSVVPTELRTPQTYLIFSEVSYLYIPTIGYVMAKAGVNMKDVSYTRPRQATCIVYSGTNEPKLNGTTCQQPMTGAPL